MKASQRDSLRSACCIALALCASCGWGGVGAIARAEGEIFETVARSQLPDTARNPSPARPRVRIDSHPAGDNADLAAAPDRPRLLDLSDPPDSLSEDALDAIVAQRKGILKSLGIEDAGPFNYPDCGGARTRRAKDTTQGLPPPKCPTDISSYITVGLPYRGAAALLARARPPRAPAPDSTRELWTALVAES